MRRFTRLMTLAIAMVFVLAACGGADHDDAQDDDTGTMVAPPTTTSGHGDLEEGPGDEFHGDVFEGHGAEAAVLPVTEPAPTVEVSWERVSFPELDRPGWWANLGDLLVVDGRLIALGTSYPEFDEGEDHGEGDDHGDSDLSEEEADARYEEYLAGITPIAFMSSDGRTWTRPEIEGLPPVDDLTVVHTDDGIVASGTVWETTDVPYAVLLTSADGLTWTADPVDNPDRAFMSTRGMALTPDGTPVVLLEQEPGFEGPSEVMVTKDGFDFVLLWEEERIEVLDSTGVVVFEETTAWLDEFRAESEAGIHIFHPATDELLMVVPHEQPLSDEGLLVYEDNGHRLELNAPADTFVVTNEDGDVVSEGTIDEMYRDRDIAIPDGQGGILLTIEFEELWEAEGELYEDGARSLMGIRTPTGWNLIEPDFEGELGFDNFASGPDGVLLATHVWDDFVTSNVYRSSDGVEWELTTELGSPLDWLSRIEGGFVGSGDAGNGGSAIWHSPDGTQWSPLLVTRGGQGSWSWTSRLGSDGERALFAIDAGADAGDELGPIALAVGEALMFVDVDYISVRLDEGETIEVLLEGFVEDLLAEGALVVDGDAVDVFSGGDLIGSVPVEEFDAALNEFVGDDIDDDPAGGDEDETGFPEGRSLYLVDGDGIVRLVGELPDAFYPDAVVFLDDTIVMVGWESLSDCPGCSGEHEEIGERVIYLAELP